jgi:hypothetical protein
MLVKGPLTMRFMLLLKADQRTEAGVLPTQTDLEVMGRFNEELVKAGVLVDGAGLQASSKGAKVVFKGGKAHVSDGPFPETKEIVAGYWILQVASKQEAIDWARRVPVSHIPHDGRDPEIEIRQMFELCDFPDLPPQVEELEKNWPSMRNSQKRGQTCRSIPTCTSTATVARRSSSTNDVSAEKSR